MVFLKALSALAMLLVVAATQTQNNKSPSAIETEVKRLAEKVQKSPLDPLVLPSLKLELNRSSNPLFNGRFEARNLRVSNLKSFKLESVQTTNDEVLLTKALVRLPLLRLEADEYALNGTAKERQLSARGKLQMELKNVVLELSGNLDPFKPQLEKLQLNVSVLNIDAKLTGLDQRYVELLNTLGPQVLESRLGNLVMKQVVRQYRELINKYLVALVQSP